MGDDLGDEWWTPSDNLDNVEIPVAEKPTEPMAIKRKIESQNTNPDKSKKRKTTQDAVFITKEKSERDEKAQTKNTKKQKKKKTITDVLASGKPAPGSPADMMSLVHSHFKMNMSVIEQEELTLPDSCFLTSNDLTHSLSSYLKEICPKWAKVWKQHTQASSALLLIICSSAVRTIELIKQLNAFKGDAKVLKLFAKHIKLEDQIKLLSKGVIHIGVGTPGRLCALIEKEGLNLQSLRYLVVDWNYRDLKKRRLVDIPEVKKDFLQLMTSGIIEKCRERTVKIGLF